MIFLEFDARNFLFDMVIESADMETIKKLWTDEAYQKLVKRQNEILKKYPIVKELFDGRKAISLSKKEHIAMQKYYELQRKREYAERKGYYWCGQKHAFEYLKAIKEM